MRKHLLVLLAAGLLSARADVTVSDVLVSQRWPWSEKVDVDFLVTGGAADVEVTATWDGHPTPYELGTVLEAKSGWNRFTWDPATSPFAGQTLTGFSVSAFKGSASTNRYLIVDLENGGVTYAAHPDGTDGKWTDDYKLTKMVFRRIPAGTYSLGLESNKVARINGGPILYSIANAWAPHQVTFSSDCYVGVFKMTVGQYNQLTGSSLRDPLLVKSVSYNEIRGITNAVNWPRTGYKVAADSLVQKLRDKAGTNDFQIDLCEERQWEVAMRAGKTTLWPNGGTVDDSPAVWTNLVDALGWRGTAREPVGTKVDNGWGIYDVVGTGSDWVLNATKEKGNFPSSSLPGTAVDSAGLGYDSPRRRVVRGSSSNILMYQLPCCRQVAVPERTDVCARFCVHLKPLVSP